MWFLVFACITVCFVFFTWINLQLRKKLDTMVKVDESLPSGYPDAIPLMETGKDPFVSTIKVIYNAVFCKEHDMVRFARGLKLNNKVKMSRGSLFGKNFVGTWHPEVVKQLLVKDKENFDKATPFIKLFGELFGESVFAVQGEQWKTQRKILSPSFHFEYIKGLSPIFNQIADQLCEQLCLQESSSFEPYPWMSKMTLDALGKAGFGFDFEQLTGAADSKVTEAYNSYDTLMKTMINPLNFFPIFRALPLESNKRYQNSRDGFFRWAKSVVDHKRNLLASQSSNSDSNAVDLLDLLVSSHSNNQTLSDSELLQNIFLFFLAGHETTSGSLTAVLHFLSKYPEVQQQCYEEIDSIFKGTNPDYESVKQLNLLNKVINESMRLLGPISAIARTSNQDCSLGGYFIPQGTTVSVLISNLHYDPDSWETPNQFNLEHWNPEQIKQRHPLSFMPFGAGPRVCLGSSFANLEMRIVLVKLLQRFKFFVHTPKWLLLRNITVQPQPGFRIGFETRIKSNSNKISNVNKIH